MTLNECDDSSFGPIIRGCRGNFDFTKVFENVFLSIIPNSLVLVVGIIRIYYLRRQSKITNGSTFQILKLGLLLVYFTIQLARVARLAVSHDATVTGLTVAATAIGVAAAAVMVYLSLLEHARSLRPSLLLTIFLLLTILFDAAMTRTSWLANVHSELVTDAYIQMAALALKLAILFAESKEKKKWIIGWSAQEHSPEETSGFISLAFMSWLNPLFLRGYHQHWTVDSLYAIDQRLGARSMFSQLPNELDFEKSRGQKLGLAKIMVKTLARPLLLPVAPRLAMIGFTFCQPFFITALVSNMQSSNTPSAKNDGYGLIGACILVYAGIALSTTFYSYYSHRAMYMIRASLVSAIYQKTLHLGAKETAGDTTVTLMSTDIERIMTGWQDIHSVWASIVEIALGCWLLHSHIGVAFLSPIVVILACFMGMAWVAGTAGKTQSVWMEKIQHRVSITSALIANIKLLKISALAPGLAHTIQEARVEEIQVGNQFRRIQVVAATIAYAPMCLSPVFAFAFTGQNLDVTSFFASLSYLVLLSSPLTTVFQQIPTIIAGFTCLSRIQEFLESDSRHDPRLLLGPLDQEKSQPSVQHHPLVKITNGQFGWSKEQIVLENVDVSIPAGQFTIVVGPVACGKSTLCKAILGEVPFTRGDVELAHDLPAIGLCDQTPLLFNLSIRENITRSLPFDKERFNDVIRATALGPDLALLPSGHDTVIGSGGNMLSGGQKQRVSLARALYHDSPLLLLDDVLSGLDQATEAEVCRLVFGSDGWIRHRGTTTILFTHSNRHLAYADHIIKIGEDGTILEHGQTTDLLKPATHSSDLQVLRKTSYASFADSELSEKTCVDLVETEEMEVKENLAEKIPERIHHQPGDLRVYKHYFGTIRITIFALFVFSCALFGFGDSFPTVWISFWASDAYNKPNAFYIGIYSTLRVLQLLGFFLAAFLALGPMVADSGSKLHLDALTTVVRAPLRFLATTDGGVITNLFSQDTTIVDGELPMRLFNIAASVCGVVGLACVIAVSSPWLALVYPLLAVILWAIQRVYLRTSRQLRILDLEAKSPLYTNFLETVRGIATIRSFGWTTQKMDENFELVDRSQRPAYLLAMVQLWLLLAMNVMVLALATLLTVLATQLRTNPGFAGASLVSLMSFGTLIAVLVRDYTAFETSIGAVSRLKTFSEDTKTEDQDGEDLRPEEQWPMQGSVMIEGLSASYDALLPDSSSGEKPRNLSLRDINLSIPPAQKVAICGRTGSGKSSLLLLLLRLLDPIPSTSCKITIDNLPIQQIDRATLRERIIAVPQDAVFLPHGNTIKSNLDPHELATEDECVYVLETVQLDALATKQDGVCAPFTANQLSGGQKKLFNLARSILRRIVKDRTTSLGTSSHGGVLLLDEISSGVDSSTENIMYDVISKEFADYTVISVVHGLDIVSQFFDRAVVLDQGVIVESGSPLELLQTKDGWFKELVGNSRHDDAKT